MKVAIIGGGPAGLYLALLLKQADPRHQITVLERNQPDSTFGWGVVFTDQTLDNFRAADEPTYRQITENFAHWDDIDVHFKGALITTGGHGFSGIARKKLLHILQERAERSRRRSAISDGGRELTSLKPLWAGRRRPVRRRRRDQQRRSAASSQTHFQPDLDVRPAKFIWLGTDFKFDAFTFYFVENEHGVFQAHCYRFDEDTSTFIVECDRAIVAGGRLRQDRQCRHDRRVREDVRALAQRSPADDERGASRVALAQLPARAQREWFHENVVLIGDAAHSAHFSIGSGTKLAMEDAIALARILNARASI